MDQLVQCPVCTLFLHNGMSLESHLDTHPKDQVIKALCSLTSSKGSSYGSRTSTPMHSERSYRSRSRTPATEDTAKWTGSRSTEHDRYWRRTPSRTSKTTPMSNTSRNGTPDIRMIDVNFESQVGAGSLPGPLVSNPFNVKGDKIPQTFQSSPVAEFDPQYVYYPDQQEDREIKYSRSAEYNAMDANNLFAYNMPNALPPPPGVKLLPAVPRRANDFTKGPSKSNNILLKSNMNGVQYIGPGGKSMHVMVPTAPSFVHKNVQSNMTVASSLPNPQLRIGNKTDTPPLVSNHLNQMTTSAGTTVVTQNSQIIYREMVHNVDGKPFVSSMPPVLGGHENVTANLSQTSSMYQNVMVVDQFGNASCMYSTPQPIMSKGGSTMYEENGTGVSGMAMEKSVQSINDPKSLIIEVGPIIPPPDADKTSANQHSDTNTSAKETESIENADPKCDSSSTTKGLKILSNIKVEVPVQHHKNMVNTVMDLTGPNDSDYFVECSDTPNKIEKTIDTQQVLSDAHPSPISSADSMKSSFSVIKNIGNPIKTSVDDKLDADFSDSCPVPDLICNEKPSISPCSELSENGDNFTERTSISPKPESSKHGRSNVELPKKVQPPQKPYRHNTLRLNNIFVKKHKKVLQIKNAKGFTNSKNKVEIEVSPTSSARKSPEKFTMTKLHQTESKEVVGKLTTVSIEVVKTSQDTDFDVNTEEQSMEIESVAPTSINKSEGFSAGLGMVQVKEEINSSNEGGFSNEAVASDRVLTSLETLRPINAISSFDNGHFDDDSNDRELLDLEAASKNKQFVNMMNENYFGNDIYADYFTPDRVEAFDTERGVAGFKEVPKDGMYNIWGESSQKDSDFVLPNFIHESYKIAESNGIDYSELGAREVPVEVEVDGCERDSKVDVLSEGRSESDPPMNICADERMPPRGEISGQESNGDMESPWSGMYSEVTPSEPYDLIARESWVSDGSDVEASEKREPISSTAVAGRARRSHACPQCGVRVGSLRQLRAHAAREHGVGSRATTYRRLLAARTIKKEEKPDNIALTSNLLTMDSKESITSTILKVYDTCIDEAKPKLEVDRIIKQEPKRKRKDYVCPTCKVDQETDAAFHAHLKIHPLECLTCGKCFFRRANLALHIKTHLGIKNYKCEVCEKRFMTRQKLMEHHNVHTGREPYKCTMCDETFKRYSNMVQHRDRHHLHKRAKVRDWVCACGAVFASRAKLLWHRETHAARPRACSYCSDKFVHAASLTRHIRRAHDQYYLADRRAENVQCPICKQVYLRANLRAHVATHAGVRAHACVVCGKAFTTAWNLKLHRWTHAARSAKPHRCGVCPAAFVRRADLAAHERAHRAQRPYVCNHCGCQFVRKYNCQRHVREHEAAKKHVCAVPDCGKAFHRSYYLSEHMKVHSGARPFVCNICGKTSSNKSNHNKHVKIHHAREPVATEA